MYEGPSVHAAIEGQRLRVELQLNALPPPTSFAWLFSNGGDEPLVIGGNIVDVGASFIEFLPVTRADAGTYSVTSSNFGGSGTFVLTVEVYCESELFRGKSRLSIFFPFSSFRFARVQWTGEVFPDRGDLERFSELSVDIQSHSFWQQFYVVLQWQLADGSCKRRCLGSRFHHLWNCGEEGSWNVQSAVVQSGGLRRLHI